MSGPYHGGVLRMLSAAAALSTLGAVPAFLLGAQFVLVEEDLALDERHLGIAVGVFFAAAALASHPAGSMADRLGHRASTLVAGALSFIAALIVAVVARGTTGLLVGLGLAGVANAALQMTANASLARSIPRHRQGIAFGIKQSAVPLAILMGGLAVPAVGLAVGWRWTYGVLALCAALVMLLAMRSGSSVSTTPSTMALDSDRAPRGALVLTAVATTLANGAANSLGAFLPAWTYSLGVSAGTSGLFLALCAAVCVAARILSGAAGDRRSGRNIPWVAVQMTIGAIGFVLLAQGDVPLVVLGALIAFGFGWAWPGLLIFAVVRVGRDRPARASSAVQAGGFAGGAAGPPLFGWLIVTTSYETGWLVAASLLLAAAALLMYCRRLFLRDIRLRPPAN